MRQTQFEATQLPTTARDTPKEASLPANAAAAASTNGRNRRVIQVSVIGAVESNRSRPAATVSAHKVKGEFGGVTVVCSWGAEQ